MSRAPRRTSAQARGRLRWRRWAAGSAVAVGADLRQLDAAFEHYRRALELNPRHRGAHEYAGEAYLMVGDLARAEAHLAALRRIGLLPCEELGDLEREIAAYRTRTGAGRTR